MQSVLDIYLNKITSNARHVVNLCESRNIEVLGVTKGFSANPWIVAAMIKGGIKGLADSRLENVASLRSLGYSEPVTLLRIPCLSDAEHVVKLTDYSLNSEQVVIEALSKAAQSQGKIHNIIMMIDVGDRREGILPEDTLQTVKKIRMLEGVRLMGIGTNMGCYGGILPTLDNLHMLLDIKEEIENSLDMPVEIVSGGGTSSLKLVGDGSIPEGINQLRIGEGILLGTDTTHNSVIEQLAQDTFILRSEIVELKEKSSVPVGIAGLDAFGNQPHFEDMGIRRRAIISLGRQDVNSDGIIPTDPAMTILGASSDHMLIDVTDSQQRLKVGDTISFRLNYQGLLHLSNSRYVAKNYIEK